MAKILDGYGEGRYLTPRQRREIAQAARRAEVTAARVAIERGLETPGVRTLGDVLAFRRKRAERAVRGFNYRWKLKKMGLR